MNDWGNGNMCAVFRYGGYAKLQKERWHAKDVVLPDAKLYYVTKGEIVIEYENETIPVCAEEMILIPPGKRHSFFLRTDAATEKYWFHFSLTEDGEDAFLCYQFAPKITVPALVAQSSIWETFYQETAELDSAGENRFLLAGTILCALGYYAKVGGVEKRNAMPDGVSCALQTIHTDRTGKLTLDDLAMVAHMSRNHFSRCFKEKVGTTPMQYVRSAKIERAKELLEHTALPIGEIMEEVGFYDAAYFANVFRKITGMSPRIFRQVYGSPKADI